MHNSIFISKNSSEVQVLQQFADQNGIAITAHSFLEFKPLVFALPRAFDVLFFGSPRAVMFYQSKHSIPANVAIASVGGKTSALLQTLGYNVAFNGEGKGSISEVATAFQAWLDDRVALFPVSTKSLGTISKGIHARQVIHVECYETQIIGKSYTQDFEVYVFTSPSNVEGFFLENVLPKSATVIAWGESTHRALTENGVNSIQTLSHPSQEALIEVLPKKH
jgi:uroporphyrinogen-III synthase